MLLSLGHLCQLRLCFLPVRHGLLLPGCERHLSWGARSTAAHYSRTSGEKKILRHEKHAKKMSACGHQPSCSNRLGESSRLAVFLLFYKEKGFYARTLVTPAGVI